TKGTIVLTLFPEDAPVTVANFVNLANREFYDGVVFHRVISDFMIQGGDPTGTGRGGPGYRFEDEFQSGRKFDKKGVLAMANAGPGTNGSQFFITHVPTPHLNNHHTIFGEVKEGQEVVDSIAQGDKIESLNIIGEIEDFVAEMNDRIGSWNAILDRN
ncbi:MAG: peptidylprolyl isomerase, partial [Candidatus Omnitrophica bacterium]|nr:peptidylprolyl isomerase [Candidatus Omnitrophota bacterium]